MEMVTHRLRDIAVHCSSETTSSPNNVKNRSISLSDTTPTPASSTSERPGALENRLVDEDEPCSSKRARLVDAVVSC